MNIKKKVLITGGAGYIGSKLTLKLLQLGFEVTVLDNLMYKQESLTNCCNFSNFKFIRGDVTNNLLISKLIKENDIIIPLAAIVGAPACDKNPKLAKAINLDSSLFLISKVKTNQMLIFPTTNSGYGIGKKDEFCNEKSPLKPISTYGKNKVTVEKKLLSLKKGISLRLATVFGISFRMRLDLLVNDFVLSAYNNKSLILFEENFRRNFIHIDDVIDTFVFCIRNYKKMKGQCFNVGLSSANMTKKQLAKKIKKYLPNTYIHSAPIGEDPDKRDYVVSNKKLENLGWKPKKNLDYGIIELIKLYSTLDFSNHKNI